MRAAMLTLTTLLAAIRPGSLHSQCPDGTPPPCGRRVAARAPAANSVAVLVFENRARDTSLALLAEGLADEITTDLGRVARLEVKSAASVRAVQARGAREPQRLGQLLGARYLVDGALLPARGNVRVSVQLVEAARGTVRWTGVYQRGTDDLFALITTVADSVAVAIVGQLAPDEAARRGMPTRSAAAYADYLEGRAALNRFDEPSVRRAVTLFEQATALDSTFALAWAGQSEAWDWLSNWQPPRETIPRARAATERALRLDSNNADVLTQAGSIRGWSDWDFQTGESFVRRALALAPRSATAHLYLGSNLLMQGRRAEAAATLHQAAELDTLDERIGIAAAHELIAAGEPDEALRIAQRWHTVSPDAPWFATWEGYWRAALGRCIDVPVERDLADVVCRRGKAAGHAFLDSLVAARRAAGLFFRPGPVADWYVVLGDKERALQWLERGIADREGSALFSLVLPWWAETRRDPRFVELWRSAGVTVPPDR